MFELDRKLISARHLIELGFIALISFILLNPLNLSLEVAATNLTPEMIKASVLELGFFAPLGMIFLDWLQVVVAPIPPVTMVASGYTFGMYWGALYTYIGMSLGSFTAILLGRKFGRPLVELIVSEAHMNRFRHLTDKHGLIVFTVIFILPGFPDDVVCYLAGLTDLDMKKLMVSASLGRIPTVIILVFTGNSIAMSQPNLMVATLVLFALASIISVKYEKKIINKASEVEKSISNIFNIFI